SGRGASAPSATCSTAHGRNIGRRTGRRIAPVTARRGGRTRGTASRPIREALPVAPAAATTDRAWFGSAEVPGRGRRVRRATPGRPVRESPESPRGSVRGFRLAIRPRCMPPLQHRGRRSSALAGAGPAAVAVVIVVVAAVTVVPIPIVPIPIVAVVVVAVVVV